MKISLPDVITPEVFFTAAITALVITFAIKTVWKSVKKLLRFPAELSFPARDTDRIIARCIDLFPTETVLFNGKSFRRGMKVRVTTTSRKTFEGSFIGLNADNIICVVSKNFITADVLDNIFNIEEISIITD